MENKGYLPEMFNPYNRAEVSEKAITLSTGSMVTSSCAVLVVDGAVIKATAPSHGERGALCWGNSHSEAVGECVHSPCRRKQDGKPAMATRRIAWTTSCASYEYRVRRPSANDGSRTYRAEGQACYIIRKATVRECMPPNGLRPTFPVSPSAKQDGGNAGL